MENDKKKVKEVFVAPTMEIVEFETPDVITTSGDPEPQPP